MRKSLPPVLALVAGIMFAVSALAKPPSGRSMQAPVSATKDNLHYLNCNQLLAFVGNDGSLFFDKSKLFGRSDGLYYPYTSVRDIEDGVTNGTVAFAAGLWMGGNVGGDVRVSVAEYSDEYTSGPMKNGTFQPENTAFHVYKLYADSLSSNPNADYLSWPVDQGAPLDSLGHPESLGKQTLWAVYNDADASRHYNGAGSSSPLGIEVQQTAYAKNGPYYEDNALYVQYKLYNRSTNHISDFYLAFWFDPDVGESSDDLIGCDTAADVFYCYNGDSYDEVYGDRPPAVGVRVLNGPVVPASGSTAIFNGHSLAGYRNLHMSAFSKLGSTSYPKGATQSYNCMKGLMPSGLPYTYADHDVRFMCSGDPISNSGDVDADPSERVMMAGFGPMTFNPGDSQQILIKVAVGRGADRLSSVNALRANLQTFQAEPCSSANILVRNHGTLTDASFSPSGGQWLTGVNWGGKLFNGGIGFGRDFIGSALHPEVTSSSFPSIEIRFSNSVRQNAYRYVRPGFAYGGYVPVPFTVWDTDHNRQLNVAVVEWQSSRIYDSTWNLDDSVRNGGREYILVFNSDYAGNDPNAPSVNYPSRNLKDDAPSLDILYAAWLCLAPDHSMSSLGSGQVLSIHFQNLVENGQIQQLNFRPTVVGDTSIQEVLIGCDGGYLSGVRLAFEDSGSFGISATTQQLYSAVNGKVESVKEMANGLGLIEPPVGHDVLGHANSTGDWKVDDVFLYYELTDSTGKRASDDWEIRFTAQGSRYYDIGGDTLCSTVPFELWNIGEGTPDNQSDDRRVAVVVRDVNGDGHWGWWDRIYLTNTPYEDNPPQQLDYYWSQFGYLRVEFDNVSGALTAPAEGTVIRLTVSKYYAAGVANQLANDPEILTLHPETRRTTAPEGYDVTCRLQFTPKQSGQVATLVQIRDSISDNLLTTISLSGETKPGCCVGTTGNINTEGVVDLTDLTALVSYLSGAGYVLPCPEEANVNGVGIVDLSDLSFLISYLTSSSLVFPNCP